MKPDFSTFKSPFELGLVALCAVAIVVVAALIVLYATDVGIANW